MLNFEQKFDDTAGTAGQLSADEFNSLSSELKNLILRSGQTLSGLSEIQIAISAFLNGSKAQTFQDSGGANAYVATPVSGASGVALPSDYANMNGVIIVFRAAATNTAASTLNIGQTTGTLLGSKAIRTQADVAIPANAILAGEYIQLRYDASLNGGSGAWALLPWAFSTLAAHGIAVFTANGTWNVPAGVNQAFVEVIGGGSGGGANANSGGGGGGGGIARRLVSLVGTSSVSVTVGAGSAGGTVGGGGNSVAGGTSSFGAFCSATGGGATANAGQDRGVGGTGTGGDINDTLGPGYQRHASGLGNQISGKGGGPGGGAPVEGGTLTGLAATGFGCGGSGGTGGAAGGAGKAGIVIVRW